MKLIIVGYGKMGRIIEKFAIENHHKIEYTVDTIDQINADEIKKLNPDVIIEFTHPDAALPIFRKCIPLKVPIVTGTTGWYNRLDEVKQLVDQHNTSFIYASNFSIGVQLFFKLNQQLASYMNKFPQYDVFIEEAHHTQKADSPSGTANSLAEDILNRLDRKDIVRSDLTIDKIQSNELNIASIRAGNIKGQHKVSYISDVDRLTLEHEAYTREGFAIGALTAAQWILNHKGFYHFSEVFE